jgi:hypothetical protein
MEFLVIETTAIILITWSLIQLRGNAEMQLVLKYLSLFTLILKRGEQCPQVKAVVAAMEATAETVVEKTLASNLQALTEKYPDKAPEIAAVGEILGHITNPTAV